MRYIFNDLKEIANYFDEQAEKEEKIAASISTRSKIVASQATYAARAWRAAANIIKSSELRIPTNGQSTLVKLDRQHGAKEMLK